MNDEEARNDIQLLAKLLKVEKYNKNALFETERDALYKILSQDFSNALDISTIKQSEKVFMDIKEIVDSLELFSYIPELLGKSLVGVFSLNDDLAKRCLSILVGSEGAESALLDTNLPCLFLNSINDILAFNDTNFRIRISKNEYYRINKVLWRHDIEIRNFLRMFSINSQSPFQNTGIFYFPQYINMAELFNQSIIMKLDTCVVLASNVNDLIQNKLWLSIERFCQYHSLPCHIIIDDKIDTSICENGLFYTDTYNTSGVYSLFEKFDIPRYNCRLVDAMELSLVNIRKFYDKRFSEIEDTQKMLANDLTYITQNDTQVTLSDLVNHTLIKKTELEKEQNIINVAIRELRVKSKAYEDVLIANIDVSKNRSSIVECKTTLDTWSDLFLTLLEIKDFQSATNYFYKIKKTGYHLTYIYDMLLQSARGEDIPSYMLNRLRNEIDTEFVRRAKIMLKNELEFADIDYMRIARDIYKLRTADEYYYRGLWEESTSDDYKTIASLYRKSFNLGSSQAGEKLMNLTHKTSDVSLQMLSDAMVPEANYALGLEARINSKFAKSNRYFKLAAAKGHILSIKILTDGIYFKVRKQAYTEKRYTSKEQYTTQNAIRLYQYVLDNDISNKVDKTEVKERIGDLYHILGDDRRALEYWKQCQTATAFFSRGRLFQYPNGTFGQNLDEALVCFQKASALGHSKAGNEYNKVLNWKNENMNRRSRQESAKMAENLATRVEEIPRENESSGCFITSAVCTALHKPDNCDELMTLRAYRDSIKSSNTTISSLVREYYRVAPLIVARIDEDARANEIYKSLWINQISETYRLVKEGKYEEATRCYIKMTVQLCEKYNVELLPNVREIISSYYYKDYFGLKNGIG